MLPYMSRRTSVIIDDDLVADAKAVLGTSGITDTIEAALTEAVRADRRRRLAQRFRSGDGFDTDALIEARATWGDDLPPG
jgi:Arc/MetJ family transcription regulator